MEIKNFQYPVPTTKQTWKKTFFYTQARFDQNLFYQKKCVNFNNSEFATKQQKMYLKTSMSKTRLLHIYKGKNYVIILICFYFLSNS